MRAVVLLFPLALSGCAGMSYIMTNYDKVPLVEFPYAEAGTSDTYRVFDRPSAGKLMITPSMSSVAGLGIMRGLTFGATAGGDIPVPLYRNAALAYLASTGRTCQISTFDLLAAPQYEATYTCPPPTPPVVADKGKAKAK